MAMPVSRAVLEYGNTTWTNSSRNAAHCNARTNISNYGNLLSLFKIMITFSNNYFSQQIVVSCHRKKM